MALTLLGRGLLPGISAAESLRQQKLWLVPRRLIVYGVPISSTQEYMLLFGGAVSEHGTCGESFSQSQMGQ